MTDTKCPRCNTPLSAGTYASARVFRCDNCAGIALGQASILPVLEKLAVVMYESVSINYSAPIIEDTTPVLSCPECHSQMERHGYMGSKQLMMDSCPSCTLVWLDPGELSTMVSMYVRLDKNLANMKMAYQPSDLVGLQMTLRAVEQAFLMGFVLG